MKLFATFLIAFMASAAMAVSSYFPPVVVTATTTSTQVMAANQNRIYLLIQNKGAVGVIVKAGATIQTAHEGVLIPSGGNYEPEVAPTNAIWIESASSTSAVTIVQGQ